MKKIIRALAALITWIMHRNDKSYKLFGEYHDGFTGFLIFRNGQAEVKNAGLIFRGDFVILVSKWHSDEDGTRIDHERLTVNVNEIVKILN